MEPKVRTTPNPRTPLDQETAATPLPAEVVARVEKRATARLSTGDVLDELRTGRRHRHE
ncbi:hypothetical protein [Streptomyces sp. NPDC005805]|uniref:hypothetical protein n=1 Tax=Streptomyces sp. NPDC005805 TaxID=3157068 RepID=UPI0033D83C51